MVELNGLYIAEDGTKRWYLNGKAHHTNGPAVERADGTKHWCINGKLHRTDGPAIDGVDGTKYWYVDGRYLGQGDAGFWALWGLLSDGQRNNLNLHMYLPGLPASCK